MTIEIYLPPTGWREKNNTGDMENEKTIKDY
jgi:hypothetical protein